MIGKCPAIFIAIALSVPIMACSDKKNEIAEDAAIPAIETEQIPAPDDIVIDTSQIDETDDTSETDQDDPEDAAPETLIFRDVYGVEYETQINPRIAPVPYDKSLFRHEGQKLSYDDGAYECMLGIDVSHHQGSISWNEVKDAGYDFAFLRIGYRGYGKEGSLNPDKTFASNYDKASAAGIKLGVYFFAQAVNEEEAAEEAEYVLKLLDGRSLDLPVVYDPESILDDEARTDDVDGEQFTKNTRVFCDAIRADGYTPMIYSNMLWEAFELDLEQLSDMNVWYADYEDVPQTPYDFEFWQYSNTGNVSGVSGSCDLNIWMKPASDG